MSSTPSADRDALNAARAFISRAERRYPVTGAFLYGSWARGEARLDSDVDIALVLDRPGDEMRKASVELAGDAFDHLLETGFYVAPLAITKADWHQPERHSNPFLIRNIQRDAIPL